MNATLEVSTAGRVAAWTLLVVAFLANIAGYVFDLYQRFWWFDRVLHFSTLLALTLWLAVIVFARAIRAEPRHPVLVFLLLAAVGVAVGALWEVTEWVFDLVEPGNVIKGKYDSIMDINMDTLGALLAAFVAVRCLHAGPAGGRSR